MRRIFIIGLILMAGTTKAQFTPVTSQYMFNTLVINPAYAGALDAFAVSASHRSQWTGFKGAPMTDNLCIHGPLKNKKVALGLMFFRDEIGVTQQNGIFVQYAYRIHMGQANLAFGVSAGASFTHSSWNEVSTISQNDPSFSQAPSAYVLPNAGFGIYFHTKNFFSGVSLPFFLSHPKLSGSGLQQVENHIQDYNVHIQAGGYIHFGQHFVLKPSFLLKSRLNTYPQADLNLMTLLYNRFGFGVSYRMDDAWIFPVQFHVNDQLMLAYSYDWGFSALSHYHLGSHELFVRYCFLFKKNVTSARSF